MGTINDFKIVKQYAKKYAEFLNLKKSVNEDNLYRLGFYHLILECVTNVKDIEESSKMIIDTEYQSLVYGNKNNDLGIDAVYINDDEKIIQLFNFKYRNNFNGDKSQKLGDAIDSSRFLHAIDTENVSEIDQITKSKINKIIEKLKSDEVWKIELYMVSNENNPLKKDSNAQRFADAYDMNIETIVLDDIISFISDVPEDLSAQFIIDNDSVMTYEIDALSSAKSYLVRLSLAELIRITCNDKTIRNSAMTDYKFLENQDIEHRLLFDNVRGFLGDTKYNKNIMKTIENNPNNFFMFNNGLTITAKEVKAKLENGQKKFRCNINGFQIVNGGQTLRSIYNFKKTKFDERKLANAEILVKIFQTEEDNELSNNIAEFTNSQNAISSIDLKSVNNLQIKLETFFKAHEILYVRKSGEVGQSNIDYKYRISMEKVAQILYSNMGYPDRATNQKKALFEKYYDEIFDEVNNDFEFILKCVNLYFHIEQTYKNSEYKAYPQKYFYIIFIIKELYKNEPANNKSLDFTIEFLENCINNYNKEDDISFARKLIQKRFKDYVIEELANLN